MAHAIWSGSINFGLVTIPVKLYSAIREHELHFNYIHREDNGRIRYERVCSVCGKKVDWSDIVRGYEVGKDEYVVMQDDDFAKASPEATQSIDIVEFVSLSQIDPILFDVPYYLEPERKGRHAYALLREVLRRSGKVGIARIVLRTREHLAALEANGNALVAELMHWADEVVPPTALDFPDEKGKLGASELKMAEMLIDTMTAEFHPTEFKDRYREQLLGLIESRAAGKPAPRGKAKPRTPTNVLDLVDVLKESLAQQRAAGVNAGTAKSRHARASTARPARRRKHAA